MRAILSVVAIVLVSLGLVAMPSPAAAQPGTRAVVLVHGGGFCAGGPGYMEPLAERIRRHGYVVYNIRYSTQCPGFDHQVVAVESAIASAKARHAKVAVWGHSAGGTLAATAATRGRVRPDALVGYSGGYDLRDAWRYPYLLPVVTRYLGCRPVPWRPRCMALAGAASPEVYASRGDPPTVLVNSAVEIVPIEQQRGMAMVLRGAGVPVKVITPTRGHGPYNYSPSPFDETMQYLNGALK